MTDSPRKAQLLALLASTVGALLLGWGIWVWVEKRRETPVLEFVGDTANAEQELMDQAALRESEQPPVGLGTTLSRFIIPEEQATELWRLNNNPLRQYDRLAHFWHKPNLDRKFPLDEHPDGHWIKHTNAAGFRNDAEVSEGPVDLRVLVAGDSHTDGICNNSESFAGLLQRDLSRRSPGRTIEALNAGKGGYSFYEYLGTLEKCLPLEPDVLVVSVFGGNDFYETTKLYYIYRQEQRPTTTKDQAVALRKTAEEIPDALGQGFSSVYNLTCVPKAKRKCLLAAREVTLEIQRLCAENDIALIYLYIPSPIELEEKTATDKIARAREMLGLEKEDDLVLTEMADAFLAFLDKRGIENIDLRDPFRAIDGPAYWDHDLHMNLRAHAAIAEALLPKIEAVAGFKP